jgi:hypothetical protein
MPALIQSVRLVEYDEEERVAATEAAPSSDEQDVPSRPKLARSNRRVHRRLPASDLQWLQTTRIKYGPEVRVLDVSTGGIAIETDYELKPDATMVFELAGRDGGVLVPARVLRSEKLNRERPLYRSACAFKRPLDLSRFQSAPAEPIPPAPQTAADAAPGAQPVVGVAAAWQKVVVRYRDGRILRGYTSDFNVSRPQLHLASDPLAGDALIVPLNQLKALFFVRDFAGNPGYKEEKTFADRPHGRKLEVTFEDGEVLVGSTLSYRTDGHGFLVYPADKRTNNLRVFVSSVAVRHVRFLPR